MLVSCYPSLSLSLSLSLPFSLSSISPFLRIPHSYIAPSFFPLRTPTHLFFALAAGFLTGICITGREIFHFSNHPVKWVRLTGVVVAIDEFAERRIITLDDSSGMCVECVCSCPSSSPPDSKSSFVAAHLNQTGSTSSKAGKEALDNRHASGKMQGGSGMENDGNRTQPSIQKPQIPWSSLHVGSVLKVKGQVGKWRDMKQLEVIKIEVMMSTEQEVRCWEEMLKFRREVLSVPWVVSGEEERECRRAKQMENMGRGKGTKRVAGKHRQGSSRKREEGTDDEDPAQKKKDAERKREREEKKKWRKEREREKGGLDPVNKINYPSMAVRQRVPGKYDALSL